MLSRVSQKSIATRFLISAGVFIALFSGAVLYVNWSVNNAHLDELLTTQAKMALEFDLAIRDYMAESVRPIMENHLDEDEFIPEVMSTSFAARNIFEKVRKEFPDYIIKFSSDNPRNPANQASAEELKMIEYFNNNPQVEKWLGRTTINGKEYLAYFSAMRNKKKCLRCHGDPEDAPASMVEQYDAVAGFHRPLGKVIALDTIAVPAETGRAAVFANTVRESAMLMSGLCLFAGIIYLVLCRLTRKTCEQNRFLRTIVDSLDHPFYVIDTKNYNITIANEAATSRQNVDQNATCYQATHRREEQCNSVDDPCPLDILKNGERSVVLEHVHYDGDGNARNVEVHAHPILDENGEISHMIEYSFDITDRKKQEERLQKTVDQLERFNQLAVGRELLMVGLKKEVDALLCEIGREKKYEDDYEEAVDSLASVSSEDRNCLCND